MPGRERLRSGVPRLELIGLLVVIAIGAALWFALTGPDSRAGAITSALAAVASATASLTALYISRESLARTDQQVRNAKRAIMLSRYPLLLPVHQAVSFPEGGGNLATHPPSQDRFRLLSPTNAAYAFLADTNDRFLVPVENVGEGPALRVAGLLWCSDGRRGELVGPTAVGAKRLAVLTVSMMGSGDELPVRFAEALPIDRTPADPYYWLEVSYIDVFANRLASFALFDPRGLGAWRQVVEPMIETDPVVPE